MDTELIWVVTRPDLTGAERCRVRSTASGWVLEGVVVAAFDGRPLDVRYRVEVDTGWGTRTVEATMDGLTEPVDLRLDRRADGRWDVDGQEDPTLAGCTDIDLGVTPATNTLPIRRLDLPIGDEQEIEAAWVTFPDLQVHRARQGYARLSEDTWRYSAGEFTADLEVDVHGLVTRYGDDLWHRPAR